MESRKVGGPVMLVCVLLAASWVQLAGGQSGRSELGGNFDHLLELMGTAQPLLDGMKKMLDSQSQSLAAAGSGLDGGKSLMLAMDNVLKVLKKGSNKAPEQPGLPAGTDSGRDYSPSSALKRRGPGWQEMSKEGMVLLTASLMSNQRCAELSELHKKKSIYDDDVVLHDFCLREEGGLPVWRKCWLQPGKPFDLRKYVNTKLKFHFMRRNRNFGYPNCEPGTEGPPCKIVGPNDPWDAITAQGRIQLCVTNGGQKIKCVGQKSHKNKPSRRCNRYPRKTTPKPEADDDDECESERGKGKNNGDNDLSKPPSMSDIFGGKRPKWHSSKGKNNGDNDLSKPPSMSDIFGGKRPKWHSSKGKNNGDNDLSKPPSMSDIFGGKKPKWHSSKGKNNGDNDLSKPPSMSDIFGGKRPKWHSSKGGNNGDNDLSKPPSMSDIFGGKRPKWHNSCCCQYPQNPCPGPGPYPNPDPSPDPYPNPYPYPTPNPNPNPDDDDDDDHVTHRPPDDELEASGYSEVEDEDSMFDRLIDDLSYPESAELFDAGSMRSAGGPADTRFFLPPGLIPSIGEPGFWQKLFKCDCTSMDFCCPQAYV